MNLLILLISILLICYGAARFGWAKWKQDENPGIYMLWIPAAAFFYAGSMALITWIFQ